MEKNNDIRFSLESVAFLLRHPWLFICPVIIITSIAIAYVANITLYYESKAILSFKVGDGISETEFLRRKNDLVANLLLGKNIRDIIKEAWPQANELTEPLKYNALVNKLRSQKEGLVTKYEREALLLTISFSDPSPNICYKVVKTAANIFLRQNKEVKEKEIEASLSFLKNQVDFYKNKLTDTQKEISVIKTELKEVLPSLSDAEKDLLKPFIGAFVIGQQVSRLAAIDEMLDQLNLQLIEAQNRLKRLERGLPLQELKAAKTAVAGDSSIQEYDRTITAKESEIAKLISLGDTEDHPEVKKLQNEINYLKETKQKKIEELKGETAESTGIGKEEMLKTQRGETEFQIETLKEKIKSIESQKSAQPKITEIKDVALSQKISRLTQLEKERDVVEAQYFRLVNQLDQTELTLRSEKEQRGLKINIVEEPQEPLKPVPFQRISKILMGLMLALGVGVGLPYFVDSMDTSVKSATELRELLQLPVLASIDRMVTQQELEKRNRKRRIIIRSLIIFALLAYPLVKLFMFIF